MESRSDRGMVRAVVSHGVVETRYRRGGHGPPVVVLGFEFGDDDCRVPDPLLPLVACCRVILPDHASITALAPSSGLDSVPFSAWFRGFLEGLGIEGTGVVAPAGLDAALTRFLVTHPGEVGRLLIVGASTGASTEAPPWQRGGVTVWRANADVGWNAIARFVSAGMTSAAHLAAG